MTWLEASFPLLWCFDSVRNSYEGKIKRTERLWQTRQKGGGRIWSIKFPHIASEKSSEECKEGEGEMYLMQFLISPTSTKDGERSSGDLWMENANSSTPFILPRKWVSWKWSSGTMFASIYEIMETLRRNKSCEFVKSSKGGNQLLFCEHVWTHYQRRWNRERLKLIINVMDVMETAMSSCDENEHFQP